MSADAIATVNARFMEAFLSQDARAIASLYTLNGTLLPPGGDIYTGYDDIESFWRETMNLGIAAIILDSVEVDVIGETAVEVGHYTLSGSNANVIDQGKYIVVWKDVGGVWKLHRDIWNTSQAS